MNTKRLYTVKTYDIRPVDFLTGKRVPLAPEQMKECACCGRKIAKISEMSNGQIFGSECAVAVPYLLNQIINAPAMFEDKERFHRNCEVSGINGKQKAYITKQMEISK